MYYFFNAFTPHTTWKEGRGMETRVGRNTVQKMSIDWEMGKNHHTNIDRAKCLKKWEKNAMKYWDKG